MSGKLIKPFIGGAASETTVLAAGRQQSRQSWDNRYTAPPVIIYLRMRLGLLNSIDLKRGVVEQRRRRTPSKRKSG